MTKAERRKLRRWSAKFMGWQEHYLTENEYPCGCWYYDDELGYIIQVHKWLPDNKTTGQIWRVVDKMRELEWWLELRQNMMGVWFASFNRMPPFNGCPGEAYGDDPCIAILKAAKETETPH